MKREAMIADGISSSPSAAGKFLLCISLFPVLLLILLSGGGRVEADIYQYRDQNGNWVLTDSPPGRVDNMKVIRDGGGRSAGSSGFRDIERDLTEKYRPRNEIEKASLSTVTVKTSISTGSGFFVNDSGYILTNKHVLRGDETQIRETEKFIAQMDDWMQDDEAAIAKAENQLRRMKSDLDDYRSAIERMTDPNIRTVAEQRYKSQSARYDYYEAQLRKQKDELEDKISRYRRQKDEFTRKAATSQHDRRFVVILKDQTELEADLVSISNDQDLALLKVEGCRSPYIRSGEQKEIVQGMSVYAIGSPLGVGDSVSSGIISGYDDDYIRTDAKIYPGNSGGPLITADGKVIGINTLKLITRKFEGMGFAVPMRKAFREFTPYLGVRP